MELIIIWYDGPCDFKPQFIRMPPLKMVPRVIKNVNYFKNND